MSPISSRKIVPAVCDLEFSAPVGHRTRKRAPHVAKELALDQLLGNGRAVHLDKRCVAPAAERVNGTGDQLFSGPVFAVDQHAAVGRRRHRHLFAQLSHRLTFADHRARTIHPRPEHPILVLQTSLAQGIADNEDRFLERERLLDEIEGAELDRADCGLDVAVARDQHHLRINLSFAQPRERRQAIHPRQPDVQDDQIDRTASDSLETRLTARHSLNGVAFITQHAAQRAAHARFVIHDEDCWLHVRGRSASGFGLRASGHERFPSDCN